MEISIALCSGKISSCIHQNAKNLGFVQSKSHVKFSETILKRHRNIKSAMLHEPFMSSIVLNFKMNSSKKSNQNKYRHKRIVHGKVKNILRDKRNYKCESCGKYFSAPQSLKLHIKTLHERMSNYKCDSCAKSFTQSGSLKHHIKTIHEEQRNYKCDSCEKSFTVSGHLKIHIKTIHEGQRKYKCDSCEKSFTTSGHLRDTLRQFMKNKENTNVTLVKNHSLQQKI